MWSEHRPAVNSVFYHDNFATSVQPFTVELILFEKEFPVMRLKSTSLFIQYNKMGIDVMYCGVLTHSAMLTLSPFVFFCNDNFKASHRQHMAE